MARLGKNTSVSSSIEQNEDEVKNMKDFTQKCRLDDLEFIVEGKSLHVSKLILTIVSPVFQRIFKSESKEGHASRLELPGKSFELFHQFLKCIYPCGLEVVTIENVFDILPLADEYQVSDLKSKCAACFLQSFHDGPNPETGNYFKVTEEYLFRVLESASLYGIKEVIKKCSTKIAERFWKLEEMEKVESGFSIPPETKIILRDILILRMQK